MWRARFGSNTFLCLKFLALRDFLELTESSEEWDYSESVPSTLRLRKVSVRERLVRDEYQEFEQAIHNHEQKDEKKKPVAVGWEQGHYGDVSHPGKPASRWSNIHVQGVGPSLCSRLLTEYSNRYMSSKQVYKELTRLYGQVTAACGVSVVVV